MLLLRMLHRLMHLLRQLHDPVLCPSLHDRLLLLMLMLLLLRLQIPVNIVVIVIVEIVAGIIVVAPCIIPKILRLTLLWTGGVRIIMRRDHPSLWQLKRRHLWRSIISTIRMRDLTRRRHGGARAIAIVARRRRRSVVTSTEVTLPSSISTGTGRAISAPCSASISPTSGRTILIFTQPVTISIILIIEITPISFLRSHPRPCNGSHLTWTELVTRVCCSMIVPFDPCILLIQLSDLLRLQWPTLSSYGTHHLVVILRAPVLGSFRVRGPIQHETVHWACDVAVTLRCFCLALCGGAVYPGVDITDRQGRVSCENAEWKCDLRSSRGNGRGFQFERRVCARAGTRGGARSRAVAAW